MLVLGGGIIGLEMGSVYSTLGARLDVVEMLDGLMQGADRDLVKVWQKLNAPRFDNIMLKTKTVGAEATKDGIRVSFEGEQAPKEPQLYDLVLQAVGRSPNGKKIGAEKAGVTVTDRGFIPVDIQMRTNVPHIFAVGDIVGQPMLAHKAVHEAHVAAEVIAGEQQGDKELASAAFNARVIPSVAYTDPEIAWVGLTEDQAKAEGVKIEKGLFPWTASGRAIANGRDEGFTKLLFDAEIAPHRRRRHRRHARGRHDRRDRAGHRDGRRRVRYRQDDPPAPDAGREHRPGGGSGARPLHRPAAGQAPGIKNPADRRDFLKGRWGLLAGDGLEFTLRRLHTPRAAEAPLPVAAAHVFDAHLRAGLGGVDELALADVDAHMAEGAAHGVEEHQVAGLEFLAVDFLAGSGLLFGAARKQVADRLGVHRAHEAAAVEAGFAVLPPRR